MESFPRKAPKDAPNVLVILYDDTGQAAWSPYGGRTARALFDKTWVLPDIERVAN